MTDKINYNLQSLMGIDDLPDEDFVQMFDLDPSLANTPALNDAMLAKIEAENVNHFIQEGESEGVAKTKAAEIRMGVQNNIKHHLAKKGLL